MVSDTGAALTAQNSRPEFEYFLAR